MGRPMLGTPYGLKSLHEGRDLALRSIPAPPTVASFVAFAVNDLVARYLPGGAHGS
jgi:hypothetical protein